MKSRNIILIVFIMALVTATPLAKTSDKKTGRAAASPAKPSVKEDLMKAQEEYKKSLRELMAMHRTGVTAAEEKLAKLQGLYRDGLISKREMEENERLVAEARSKVAEVQKQIESADSQIAQVLVEVEAIEQLAKGASNKVYIPSGAVTNHPAYIRYSGAGNWSLANAANVEGFFTSRFNRRLPVTAYGQSEVHNRMGFDHRNAIDVGVHPDSAEGKALMAYLQSQGIPFMAFRRAIPGSATGPHIHVGRPSHRIASR